MRKVTGRFPLENQLRRRVPGQTVTGWDSAADWRRRSSEGAL